MYNLLVLVIPRPIEVIKQKFNADRFIDRWNEFPNWIFSSELIYGIIVVVERGHLSGSEELRNDPRGSKMFGIEKP